MLNRFIALIPVFAVGLTGTVADARDNLGYTLSLSVPVVCTLKYKPGFADNNGGRIQLGELQEFCNAPNGYQLVVNYTPGALRGAVIMAGEERVVLDGSGQATLNGAVGPRIQNRALAAIPASGGFDADRLDLRIIAR